MKKYFVILTILAFGLISCEEQLNRVPDDTLIRDTAYQNVDDIATGVVGIYTGLDYTWQADLNAIFTDNTKIGFDTGGQKVATFNIQLDPQINSFGIWINQYNTANDANRIIEAAAGIEVSSEDQQRLDNLLAQCYLIRAFAHMELLVYYGEDLLDPSSLGVPYQLTVETNAEPPRLTVGETLAQINEDISTAENLFSSDFDEVFRVNPDYARFLRVRLALYTGDYPSVISLSNPLINNYPLADQAQYANMFNGDTDQTEVIYSYDNQVGANFNNIATEFRFGNGGSFIGMSNELYNILLEESESNNDIRFDVNLAPDSRIELNELKIHKYPFGGSGFINDFKAARISEVYLMRAEAFARQSDFQEAANAVQAVRNARRDATDSAPAYSNLVEAISDIAFERRLELCYEGHRYVDLKRFRNILNEGMTRDPLDCPGSIPCGLSVNDRRWTFPIPLEELNGNANMVQNPEW